MKANQDASIAGDGKMDKQQSGNWRIRNNQQIAKEKMGSWKTIKYNNPIFT